MDVRDAEEHCKRDAGEHNNHEGHHARRLGVMGDSAKLVHDA